MHGMQALQDGSCRTWPAVGYYLAVTACQGNSTVAGLDCFGRQNLNVETSPGIRMTTWQSHSVRGGKKDSFKYPPIHCRPSVYTIQVRR
jgi:hypothetical protein